MIATFPFTKRLIDTTTSDRCNNAKLGNLRTRHDVKKMRPGDGVGRITDFV
ncbi:hypothetical protein ABIB94_002786 [Bradyrhizobium sp. JR7.2]|uniref:hypothetical protein n=1 Tax=unclassified Bradyrhizobium TaxID=2631580 RepID=UPI0033945403